MTALAISTPRSDEGRGFALVVEWRDKQIRLVSRAPLSPL